MSNILGIDLSLTGTGLAILTDQDAFLEPVLAKEYTRAFNCFPELLPTGWYFGYLVAPVPKGVLDRWQAILSAITMCAENVHQVVIENYSFGSPFKATAIAELGGIVKYHLAKMGHNPLMVAPSTLKKFLTGGGHAEKSQVLKEVYKRYRVDLPDDNMADAFGLAKFGQAMISTEGLLQFQIDVIENFKNPKPKSKKTAGELMQR